MKNLLFLILAIIIVSVIWGILKALVFGLIGTVFHLAMLAIFCYLVYLVYKAMTDKQRI